MACVSHLLSHVRVMLLVIQMISFFCFYRIAPALDYYALPSIFARAVFCMHNFFFYRFREQKTSFHYFFFSVCVTATLLVCSQFIKLSCFLTARIGTVCSKKGACRYTDPSGNIFLTCTILNTTCTASCYCDAGYGGKDCSLNPSSLAARDKIRYQLDGLSFFLVTSVNNIDLSIVIQTGVVLK